MRRALPMRGRDRQTLRSGDTLMIATLFLLAGCSQDDAEQRRRTAGPNPTIESLMRVADAGRGATLFGQCAACHTIGQGAPDRAGPNLFGIVGKPIGEGSPGFGYTAALASKGGRWTPETLSEWLRDPQRFAPGTRMIYPGISDPLDRADLIAYLRSQAPTR